MPNIKIIKDQNLKSIPVSHQRNLMKKVIVGDREIPGLLQFAKASFSAGDILKEHSHINMYEIFYVIRGKIKIFYEDIEEIIVSGDSIIIYPKQKHSFHFIEKTELIYFNIEQC